MSRRGPRHMLPRRFPPDHPNHDSPVPGGQYKLVFGRPENYLVIHRGSLLECMEKRQMSGDLILNPEGRVAGGSAWLFPWEKNTPDCYVRQQQQQGWRW